MFELMHALARQLFPKLLYQTVTQPGNRRQFQRPYQISSKCSFAQGFQIELLLKMLTISFNWNGQPFHRAVVEMNKEDEISFAHFFRNFEVWPLLDPFPCCTEPAGVRW